MQILYVSNKSSSCLPDIIPVIIYQNKNSGIDTVMEKGNADPIMNLIVA